MEFAFTVLRQTRENVLGVLDSHSLEELNTIPDGFSNNLIWNSTHIAVTQQLLVYGLSGLPLLIPAEVVTAYRKGTRPEGAVTAEEAEQVKAWLRELPDQTMSDIREGKFQQFRSYDTSYGVALNSLEEAIAFNNSHEALHLGYMMSLRKAIG